MAENSALNGLSDIRSCGISTNSEDASGKENPQKRKRRSKYYFPELLPPGNNHFSCSVALMNDDPQSGSDLALQT